jgi:hypothetical protein
MVGFQQVSCVKDLEKNRMRQATGQERFACVHPSNQAGRTAWKHHPSPSITVAIPRKSLLALVGAVHSCQDALFSYCLIRQDQSRPQCLVGGIPVGTCNLRARLPEIKLPRPMMDGSDSNGMTVSSEHVGVAHSGRVTFQ